MAELVRVAALAGYFETMAGLGLIPHRCCRNGLRADCWQSGAIHPARAAIRLLERSAEKTGA